MECIVLGVKFHFNTFKFRYTYCNVFSVHGNDFFKDTSHFPNNYGKVTLFLKFNTISVSSLLLFLSNLHARGSYDSCCCCCCCSSCLCCCELCRYHNIVVLKLSCHYYCYLSSFEWIEVIEGFFCLLSLKNIVSLNVRCNYEVVLW